MEVKMDNSKRSCQHPRLSSGTECFTSSQQRWRNFLFNFMDALAPWRAVKRGASYNFRNVKF